MAKQGGLGMAAFVGGYDLSGDIMSFSKISGSVAVLDVTPINKSAHVRLTGLRDGGIDFNTAFDPAIGASHPVLAALPRGDVQVMGCINLSVGGEAACMNAKQIDYNPNRQADGMLDAAVTSQANSYGLEWGKLLTPGAYTAANSLTGQNAGFEGGLGNWVAVTNCAVTDTAAQAHTGSNSMAMTSTAAGTMNSASCVAGSIATQGFAVVPGNQVLVQAWVRAAVSARTCSVGVDWYTSGGAFISTSLGTGAADSASAWTLISGSVSAPATAAYGRVNVQVASTGAGSEVHYVDDVVYNLLPGSYDSGGSLAFGAQAYLQVTAFTGTDATIAVVDSADNTTFAAVTGLTFAQTTAANTTQRLATSNTATIRRYLGVSVSTVGGFTALSFAVSVVKNPIANQVF